MMNTEAVLMDGHHSTITIPAPGSVSSGEVIKLDDNRAAIVTGLNLADVVAGDPIAVVTRGPVKLKKATGLDLSADQTIFWDASGNTSIATGASGDFQVGPRISGGASADDFVVVDLNATAGTAV